MLRKMRIDGPAERLQELIDIARLVGLDLDDYAIDTSTEYGWPSRADGHAYVLAVVDDKQTSITEVVELMRAAHQSVSGEPSEWIIDGGSFVYLPDGMESVWYDEVVPLAEALHAAEHAGDEVTAARLRRVLVARVGDR